MADLARSRGVDTQRVWLATGRNWPDTLAAGPAAAQTGALLLLADGMEPRANAAVWNLLEIDRVRRAWVVGGPDVLSPATAVEVERRAAG
ncbi:cell wall-binding repeat-containing protein [Euzebya sp.]|uniref:cell wall-binding repeat-containing protein n=1 Tax=Euzebya sp. TaxID=1971409 RepID=UPI0035175490